MSATTRASTDTWVETAEEFLAAQGLGARGKYTTLTRMLNPSTDVAQLSGSSKYVCAYRPRGILSGFLVIHPNLQYAVYLPPQSTGGKPQPPMRFWMRIAPTVYTGGGAILSAYLYNKRLVLEDLVYLDGTNVWNTAPFPERWARLKRLLENDVRQDTHLQNGIELSCTTYIPLGSLGAPPDDKIVEFIQCDAVGRGQQRRILWIPGRGEGGGAPPAAAATAATHTAKRESVLGPDVYSIYEGDKKLGTALVRTLAVSRALRLAGAAGGAGDEMLRVQTQFNKQFDKWEIMAVGNDGPTIQ